MTYCVARQPTCRCCTTSAWLHEHGWLIGIMNFGLGVGRDGWLAVNFAAILNVIFIITEFS